MSELFVDFREDEIVVSEFGYPTYTFRLVDHIPLGYIIWNIGKHHMPEGYLPLCRLSDDLESVISIPPYFAIRAAGSLWAAG